MHESNLPRFSWDEVAQGKEEFFDFVIGFACCFRSAPANQPHWESRKSDSTTHELRTTTLPIHTMPADRRLRVNVDFRKAAPRFFFSTARFVAPMSPACPLDEGRMAVSC